MYIDPCFERSNRASPARRSGVSVASVVFIAEGAI
jgi:hypothetical protein